MPLDRKRHRWTRKLPVTEESVQEHIKAGAYVQSDDPKIIEKAREIIGEKRMR